MDTVAHGWSCFEPQTLSGKDSGNDEDECYRPEQCQVRGTSMFLVLSHEDRWWSGRLKSRQNLTQMCPDGGELECVIQGPNLQFHDCRRSRFARGVWPAVWLLGDGHWPNCGELDLYEQMMHTYDDCNTAFSTAHFGNGHDLGGGRGLPLASYVYDEGDHSLKFTWERRADRAWVLSYTFDDRPVFKFATACEGALASHPDAARIFQRAFDCPEHGLRIIANLALGGRPFGRDSHAALKMADFVLRGVRVRPLNAARESPR
jgi:hypothetical protein